MNWSVGESGALALKAARGAGMAWGLAEEAGFAVRWLQQRGVPGVEAMARYLAHCETNMNDAKCPIATGTSISDMAVAPPASLGLVREPLLLIPFIAAIATPAPVRMHIGTAQIDIFASHFICETDLTDLTVAEANCALAFSPLQAFLPADDVIATRVPETAAQAMQELSDLAHRTYAPATEASRLSGAGAGLNDND